MKRTSIIIFLFAIAVMLCTLQLCNKPEQTVGDLRPEKYWRERNEKELFSINQIYQYSLARMENKNDSLLSELKRTKSQLDASKKNLHLSKLKVLALVQKDTVNIEVADRLNDYDSLKNEVVNYIHRVDSTEAFYDSTIVQLQHLAELKDSSLIICRNSYDHLRQISEDNLRREKRLTADLEEAIKVQKRKNLKNKFIAGGFVIISGILATILIKGK